MSDKKRLEFFKAATGTTCGLRPTAVNATDEDRRQLVQDALVAKAPGRTSVFIVAMDSNIGDRNSGEVVYEFFDPSVSTEQSKLFRSTFSIGEDNAVTFGEPTEVVKITSFEPVAMNIRMLLAARRAAELADVEMVKEELNGLPFRAVVANVMTDG